MKTVLIKLITLYQFSLSLLIGRQCRFYPSCSEYTKQAIDTHGALNGIFLGSKRIARCHPWCEGGYDPVPGCAEPGCAEHRAQSKADNKLDAAPHSSS